MASISAEKDSCLRKVFRVIENYDLEKLLDDAVTSSKMSERERKKIVDNVHSKTEMWDEFRKLVLERDPDRLTDFVSFILEYDNRVHCRVQDAALGLAFSVLSLRQTVNESGEYLPNSNSQEDSPSSSPSTSYNPSQMDPADTDFSKDFCFQEGDMHPPDIGYCSDLSKNISQDQSQHCYVGSKSPQPVCSRHEMTMPVRMYPRENRKRYSNRRSVQQYQKEQSSSPVSPPVLRRSEDVDDATTVAKGVEETVQKRSSYLWPPPHYEALIQNLNIQALLPHLLKNELLTQGEYEEIARFKDTPTEQNQHFILAVLPRKGQSAHEKFVESLKAERQHLGHRDLVKLLATNKQ